MRRHGRNVIDFEEYRTQIMGQASTGRKAAPIKHVDSYRDEGGIDWSKYWGWELPPITPTPELDRMCDK